MVDFGWLGHIAFTWQFFAAVMSIILIDLVLAGDNAVVIAMAVRNLPGKQRLWGIALGAGAAVVVPTCVPVALSFSRRSVIVPDSSAERATVSVLMFTPSVEPVESVNEPRRALFVPAIIVWLP